MCVVFAGGTLVPGCFVLVAVQPRTPPQGSHILGSKLCNWRVKLKNDKMARSKPVKSHALGCESKRVQSVVAVRVAKRSSESKRVFSSAEKRRHVEAAVQSGVSLEKYALTHGLCANAIYKWRKNYDKLCVVKPTSFSTCPPRHLALELQVMDWVRERLGWRRFILTPAMIKVKARDIAKALGIQNFSASKHWYDNFKERNGLYSTKRHGERSSADIEAAKSYANTFTEQWRLDNDSIFNIDESIVFYQRSGTRSVVLRGTARLTRGFRQPQKKLGAIFGLCADGSTLIITTCQST